jgi:flagellar assembly protein FliH
MTSSSELLQGRVVRGVDISGLQPARLGADLRTSPFVHTSRVDPRLMDPSLEIVVAEAVAEAQEQARIAGYADGHEAGRLAAVAAAEQVAEAEATVQRLRDEERDTAVRRQVATAVSALAAAAEHLQRTEAPARAELERSASALGVDIAEALVGHHLQVAECAARDAVVRALALAPDTTAVTVRVAPADAELLIGAWPEGRAVTVVADPTVAPGGCVVDAGMRRIDAQAATALARIREVLGA